MGNPCYGLNMHMVMGSALKSGWLIRTPSHPEELKPERTLKESEETGKKSLRSKNHMWKSVESKTLLWWGAAGVNCEGIVESLASDPIHPDTMEITKNYAKSH